MKKLIYILPLLLIACGNVYTITDSQMIKEERIIEVKKHRARNIIRKFDKMGLERPQYKGNEMELYFEHIDSTIRFRPNEIKQMR